MWRVDDRHGSPFDIVLLSGSTLSDGSVAPLCPDFVPLVGHTIEALMSSGLGRETGALANNVFRRVASTTDTGDINMIGSAGLLRLEFSGPATAEHFSRAVASMVLVRWADATDERESVAREAAAANSHHLSGDYELMTHVQHDEEGRRLLGDFDKELAADWRNRKPSAKRLLAELVAADEAFGERRTEAVAAATARFSCLGEYAIALESAGLSLLDHIGPASAIRLYVLARQRLDAIETTLIEQREAFRVELENADLAAAEALAALEQALRGRLFRVYAKPLRVFIEAATVAHRVRYAFDLIEKAVISLAGSRAHVDELTQRLEGLKHSMSEASERLRVAVDAVEQHTLTPIQELIARPICTRQDVHQLYLELCGVPWGALSDAHEGDVFYNLPVRRQWLGAPSDTIGAETAAAASPLFAGVAAMSSDAAIRWKCAQSARSPDHLLRDYIEMAPVQCRYDRARLPDMSAMRDASFTMIGVPDRDSSVFSGTSQGLLVSTDDPEHVVVLRLTLGFPVSALWSFERYRHEFEALRKSGVIGHDIYRGFPHHLRRAWTGVSDVRNGARRKRNR